VELHAGSSYTPDLYIWKDMWLASIATETGPILAIASCKWMKWETQRYATVTLARFGRHVQARCEAWQNVATAWENVEQRGYNGTKYDTTWNEYYTFVHVQNSATMLHNVLQRSTNVAQWGISVA
jgi:hypothetical protein